MEGPVGFPFTGVPLGYPGGRAGPMSFELPQMPPSEQGMRPPTGLATENELYQTASSDRDVSGPVDVDNPVAAGVAAAALPEGHR